MEPFFATATTFWGLVMAASPLLQARVIVKNRRSGGISVGWIGILLVGFLLWICYGLAIGSYPLILTNIASCLAYGITLLIVLRYRRPAAEGSRPHSEE